MLITPAVGATAEPWTPPVIAHLPFLLDRGRGPCGTLLAHVARANPARLAAEAGAPAVAVFSGPHAYISPGWYTSRDEVPTWNYVVVHAHGVLRALDDAGLLDLLARLAAVHEQGRPDPWSLADLTPETMGELFPAITGFAMEITAIEGKLKLSQNRRPEDREGAIRGLAERGSPDDLALVGLMTRPG
jgi:transcriptional regulator